MKMKSLKITHFFDVIKKESKCEDQNVIPAVEPDLNHVKQEYHYKEELDVSWDERDNDYGMGQENVDVSNDLAYKLGFPIVLVERLPDDVVNKRIPSIQHETKFKNVVPGKCNRRGFLQYYQKFCTGCKKRVPSEKRTHECENCDIRWHYECKKCSKKLSSCHGMVHHLKTKCVEKGNYYKCFKCPYKSIDKYNVKIHLKNVHLTSDSLSRIEKLSSQNVQIDIMNTAKLHKCSKCENQFKELPQLLRHIQTCGQTNYNSNSFVATVKGVQDKCLHHCVKCNKTVKKNDGVGNFQRRKCWICHSKFSFKCKKCDRICQSYGSMSLHVKTKHIDTQYLLECPKCHYKTHSIYHLTDHFRNSHLFESQDCPKCNRNYKNRNSFEYHLRVCNKEATFQCDHCSRRTESKKALKIHIFQAHTTGNEVDCPLCGKTFNNNNCLKTHIKYCKKKPFHHCNTCSYKTKYKSCLKRHYESVHGDAQMKKICPNCTKECKNKRTLRCHVNRCCGKLSCKYCRRVFKRKSSLTQHIKRAHYTLDKLNLPYLHCDDCLYKTKFRGNLAQHVTIHLENNAKDCSKCGRTYKNNNCLKVHRQFCGKKPHLKCDHCLFKTKYKYYLGRHIEKLHTITS